MNVRDRNVGYFAWNSIVVLINGYPKVRSFIPNT